MPSVFFAILSQALSAASVGALWNETTVTVLPPRCARSMRVDLTFGKAGALGGGGVYRRGRGGRWLGSGGIGGGLCWIEFCGEIGERRRYRHRFAGISWLFWWHVVGPVLSIRNQRVGFRYVGSFRSRWIVCGLLDRR